MDCEFPAARSPPAGIAARLAGAVADTQAESDRAAQSRPKERIEIMGLSSQDHPKTVILVNAG
jgi:hypothetical protein